MRYFTPQDVKESDAAKVLDFLNTVEDAETIAKRIEFENELDIGIGIAKRLMAAREANGGSFPDLQAVDDVAYVGPERFTEIVCGIAGLPLPWLTPEVNATLYDEMRRLRTIVDGLSKANVVQAAIEVRQDIVSPLLGQPLNIKIKVYDAQGAPLVNRPLTLETNQGILTTQYGLNSISGEVVELVTGVDGSARAQLSYQTYERLTEAQRVALESELQFISEDVASPSALTDGFERLSASYEHERNRSFRGALDVYFKDSERQLKDTVNTTNYLNDWVYKTALLRVYLHPATTDNHPVDDTVVTMATHVVRWKNWVLPWYQSYLNRVEKRENLPVRLLNTKIKFADSNNLSANLLNETYLFMANQYGRIGASVGEDIAGKSMLRFLAKDMTDLSPDQKISLFPALSLAAGSIKASGQGTLALVNKTKMDLEKKVANIEFDTSLLDSVTRIINDFNSEYQQFKSSKIQFDRDFTAFSTKYTTFNTDFTVFNTKYTQFDTSFTTFNADYTDFSEGYRQFELNLNNLNSDIVRVNADLAVINESLTTEGRSGIAGATVFPTNNGDNK